MQWSDYQLAIFDFIVNGTGSLQVDAVAGSGKTTTLIELLKRWAQTNPQGRSIFVAFNKAIAAEIAKKLKGVPSGAARTIHSVGLKLLSSQAKHKVDPDKYRKLIRGLLNAPDAPVLPFSVQRDIERGVVRMIDLARVNLLRPERDEDMRPLRAEYGIVFSRDESAKEREKHNKLAFGLLATAYALGMKQARQDHIIDFTDMIYLPVVWKLLPHDMDLVLIDEAQDLSNCQRTLVLGLVKPEDGRVVAVGDPYQAIYGFAGANMNSFWQIKEETDATVLPLSVNYRCGRAHIDLAQKVVPQIQAHENAVEGVVRSGLIENDLPELVKDQPGTFVIGRKTAPLLTATFRLLAQKIPAKMRGRDIGKALVGLAEKVKDWKGGVFRYQDMGSIIASYMMWQERRMAADGFSEDAIASFCDKCEALRVCVRNFNVNSIGALGEEINKLFSDKVEPCLLMTAHRAKGLETDRVIILEPGNLPLLWEGQNSEQYQQELNLLYVAITRAKQELIFLGELPGPLNEKPAPAPLLLSVSHRWSAEREQRLARFYALVNCFQGSSRRRLASAS